MPNSGPGARIEGFRGFLTNPSRHGNGEAACYGGVIEGEVGQYERGRVSEDCHCGVWQPSFMLATRALGSFGFTLGDVQCLVEERRWSGTVGRSPLLRGPNLVIASYIYIFTRFNALRTHVRFFSYVHP